MKVGFWDAPEGAEQPVSVFPIGEESLNATKGSLTAAGALAKLATLDSVELAERCPNAVALLAKIAQAIAGQKADGPTQLFRLANLNELESKLIADVLGEGEVAGVVALPDGSLAQIQESVLAGIWRVRLETDAASEYLEIGAIPEIVKRAAADLTSADFEIGEVPEGAMSPMRASWLRSSRPTSPVPCSPLCENIRSAATPPTSARPLLTTIISCRWRRASAAGGSLTGCRASNCRGFVEGSRCVSCCCRILSTA